MTFTNNSTVADAEVSVGFVSGSSTAKFNITNPAKTTPNNIIAQCNATAGAGNWYALADLSQGVEIENFSGRIYVCYGQAWAVEAAYYEPAQNITDVNFFLRYDKVELTFNGAAADVGDLTSIDYWSIPMQLDTSLAGVHVQSDNGFKTGVTAQKIFNALNDLTSTPVSGLANAKPALVPGTFTQNSNQAGSGFARIIGPSSYPPIGGVPITPYDTFSSYLEHLVSKFGPNTVAGAKVPTLGAGTIATISGQFSGVGPNVPATGPTSAQAYDLVASIDASSNITLTGTVGSVTGTTTMKYLKADMLNPSGIYGANAQFSLDGAAAAKPLNDVYGWIAGDLFAGINIGAVGSSTEIGTTMAGAMKSSDWFKKIPNTSLFSNLQSESGNYNQYANALQGLSDVYNFAYSDRFSAVQISVNIAKVDTLTLTLLDDTLTT